MIPIILSFIPFFGTTNDTLNLPLSKLEYVDPFIGTADDHGQMDPSATIPFGMAKPGPDTDPMGQSGYDYTASSITGFSNTRYSGVGCRGTGGNLRVMPFIGNNIPRKTNYLKETEQASPGFYQVKLANQIQCKLTATQETAIHCYTFPKSEQAGISINLKSAFHDFHRKKYQVEKNGIIKGKVSSKTVCGQGIHHIYFAMYLDKIEPRIQRKDGRVNYLFSTEEGESLSLFITLSSVSTEKAKKKLLATIEKDFDEIKDLAQSKWNKQLSKVEIQSDNLEYKTLFYTHLYHSMLTPFVISDPKESYRGIDGQIYQSKEVPIYHGWSIWDTFRTKLPLMAFLNPKEFSDMTQSIHGMYLKGKQDWATKREPFLTVRTEHAIIVLLDAYRKGLLPFDLNSIYPYLKKEVDELTFETPDKVLESSYDLWAFSEIAQITGHLEDQKEYFEKAMGYQTTWKEKFLTMNERSDIMHGDGLYEGTLWQYRWFVPFDISGIQKMMGGKKEFENQLDVFFENEYFNIGNQPDIQVPFLYAYTDNPWKSQELVQQILTQPTNNWYGTHKKFSKPSYRKVFQATPDGYIKEMDDDGGTMSAWYVWSAMGLYPVFPGSSELVITTPLFDKITIQTQKEPLIIQKHGTDSNTFKIKRITFNEVPLTSYFIDGNKLTEGGKLDIYLE